VDNPQSNNIVLRSKEFPDKTLMAPSLTEDDSFNSQPLLGNLAYRLPSIEKLFGLPLEQFDTFGSLTFWLEVYANHDLVEEPVHMKCKTESKCKIVYHRHYTPVIHYLNPPVVYQDATTELWFDPKSTMNLITDLQMDQKPFINARIHGALLDFEDTVEHTTLFSYWRKNRVRGQVGELPIADNHSISMTWETGKALVLDHALHCDITNTTCYQAKSVPVIFNVSSNTGYKSGGQNLTVHGHGFGLGNISAKLDGVDCKVSQYQETSFSCEVDPKDTVSTTNVSQAGSHGLRVHQVYTHNRWPGWNDHNLEPTSKFLAMNFET